MPRFVIVAFSAFELSAKTVEPTPNAANGVALFVIAAVPASEESKNFTRPLFTTFCACVVDESKSRNSAPNATLIGSAFARSPARRAIRRCRRSHSAIP